MENVDPACRCAWANSHPLLVEYHDTEWGVPVHSDQKLFEFLVLDGAQAGLSWLTILKKREGYRAAFVGFDAARVAMFTPADVDRLMADASIVRNHRKIAGAIASAGAFLDIQARYGSFDQFIWSFTNGETIRHEYRELAEIPTHSSESDAMSAELVRKGFRFVGTTICYAFMQAAGMINDHLVGCFRYTEVAQQPHTCPSRKGDDAPKQIR